MPADQNSPDIVPTESRPLLVRTLQRARSLLARKGPVYVVATLAAVALTPYVLAFLKPLVGPRGGSTQDEGLGIKELVAGVKEELVKSEEERILRGEAPLFIVKDLDLEISFVIRASTKHSSGARFQVLVIDNELQTGAERIQKLTLHMTAVPPSAETQSLPATTKPLSNGREGARVLTPVPPKEGDHR